MAASIWPIVLSPFIGSFIGVLVTRAEDPGSIVLGRSACPSCGHRLSAIDLVPVLSWLALRGRCRYCHAPIGVFYPLIELAALAVAVWSALALPNEYVWASCVLGWALLALAATDFKVFLLPDILTLPLIAAGLIATGLMASPALINHGIGAVAGFLFVVVLRFVYRQWRGREGMGLGDAKLLAASGAWVSWSGLPSVVLLAALSALVFALLKAARGSSLTLSDRLPFGAFLCFGTWIVWLYGPLVWE